MRIGKLDTHPAADAFPLLEGPDHVALVDDIRAHGQREPIITEATTGLIVDGRNRARACFELGLDPVAVPMDFEDVTEVVGFVLSRNLHRRHLTTSQRAIVADRISTLVHGQKAGDGDVTQNEAAGLLRVSPRMVRTARELAKSGRDDLVESVASGQRTLSRAAKLARRDASAAALRAQPAPLPTGPFDVVEADPPWRYNKNAAMADVEGDRRGDVDYPDMSCEEIIALNVPAIMSENSILLLWTTNAHMPEAVDIVRAWGLEWKTIKTWKKPRIGAGDWLRGQTEHCIVAVKGSPVVFGEAESTFMEAAVREHSRKPVEFYDFVERWAPGTKVSLFSREAREGWTVWGVDVDKFPNKPQQRNLEGT